MSCREAAQKGEGSADIVLLWNTAGVPWVYQVSGGPQDIGLQDLVNAAPHCTEAVCVLTQGFGVWR